MRIPKSLEALADDGIIQEVLRPLMSGKEAQIYLVISENRECAAKIYKDAQNRSFKNRADYLEGRKVRNTRDLRAMSKGTKYGRSKDEDAWKSTEVDIIYRLRAAGARVPTPYTFVDGVLVMELVTDGDGNPAPRLGDLPFSAEEAHEIYRLLLREVVRMLCAGVVHGDLSEFNVLLAAEGPVIIDFPQAVDAAGNTNARALLIRDVNNLHRFLERWDPGARRRQYAEEMWALYESNRLTPDTRLTGQFRSSKGPVDTRAVQSLISDARRDAARHQPGPKPRGDHRTQRHAPSQGDSHSRSDQPQPATAGFPRRREVVVVPSHRPGGPTRGRPERSGYSARSGTPGSHGGSPQGSPARGASSRGEHSQNRPSQNGAARGGSTQAGSRSAPSQSGPSRGPQGGTSRRSASPGRPTHDSPSRGAPADNGGARRGRRSSKTRYGAS